MNLTQQKQKSNQSIPFKAKEYEFNHFERKINVDKFSKDRRMRFRNSKDPIYIAFEYLDSQPLDKLAKDFVKETINDSMECIMNFISMVKQ